MTDDTNDLNDLTRLSDNELAWLAERTMPFTELRHLLGLRGWGTSLLYAVHDEQQRREYDKALTRARFDAIAAELTPTPDDIVGDTSGLPSWSQISAPER